MSGNWDEPQGNHPNNKPHQPTTKMSEERTFTYDCWCGNKHLVGDTHVRPFDQVKPPPPIINVSEEAREAERLYISISKILHGGHDEPSMLIVAEIVKFRQLAINSAIEKITKENEELRAILRNKDTTFREALESVIILKARIKELETALKAHGITQVEHE